MRRSLAAVLGLALVPALALAGPAAADEPEEQFRALWVDAFNVGIYTPDQVTTLVEDASDLGVNALIVQIGRRFDCFCNDALYPRTDARVDPAPYDPLAEVIEVAHAAGIEVHAWVNATTLWNSATPPTSPEHAFNAHGPTATGADRWLNQREDGTELVGNNSYIDPANPAAVDYVVEAITSITENYDVDGVNLDYIRYPDYNSGEFQNDWGYSETSLARFAAETGRTDRPAVTDEEFSQWRRDQVSALVRKIYVAMYGSDPSDRLSINGITYAFGPVSYGGWENTRPYTNVLQDWVSWLDEGIIDTITAMNYKRNWMPAQAQMFTEWNDALIASRADRHVVNGPALYLNELPDIVAQAEETVAAGFDGWSGYSYANFSATATASSNPAVKDAEREAVTAALRAGPLADDVVVPEMEWKTQPTAGVLEGTVTLRTGVVADQVDVQVQPLGRTPGESFTVTTDGSGWFAAVDLAPGRYRLRVVEDGATGAGATVLVVAAGQITSAEVTAGGV
ncbi:family 10 glycosylhydrolase [Occultella gossypii]|uniref:Family 10 glycosylhydrolase n=1 Tax=Occultella gossypii TaxID=2800820 RepID=A0ABS7S757_9MICO|nr:family 10 glycosylhydrolase [Occultella gossypii]MBZ2196188.1 family 10 glycosylhydrolase [Occultella gossypii]